MGKYIHDHINGKYLKYYTRNASDLDDITWGTKPEAMDIESSEAETVKGLLRDAGVDAYAHGGDKTYAADPY